jgi:hypothetical protein
MVHDALSTILTELADGAGSQWCWVLNTEDPGLLRSLDRLSAAEASAVPPAGGSSIAAHVDHVRYGLSLLNRWSGGENPFDNADWSASWRRTTVSDEEWKTLRRDLGAELHTWRDVVRTPRTVDEMALTGMVASVVHLAYHLGAIRQMNRALRGPSARD